MIKKKITFSDSKGEHICYKTGRKLVVNVPAYARTSIEEQFIYAVRGVTCDSGVRPGIKVNKDPKSENYIMMADNSCYFVRKKDSHHIEIIVNESGFGFYVGRYHKLYAHSYENMVIFWIVEKSSGIRIGHYRYFEW